MMDSEVNQSAGAPRLAQLLTTTPWKGGGAAHQHNVRRQRSEQPIQLAIVYAYA
jgi:hypothetical protein